MSLKVLIALSMVLALGSFLVPQIRPGLSMVLWPLFLWVLVLCLGVVQHRLQGLWLLIGAPLAFYNVISLALWRGIVRITQP
jgi:hypothetical protein